MFIDTHCHLHDAKFPDVDQVVKEYLLSGVDAVINMGCCAKTSNGGKVLSEKYSTVYFATGCHPGDVNGFDEQEFNMIKALASHEKCVAIGEIGLDYYWPGYDKDKQKDCFIKQIEFANEVKLPISIHSRDATGDMLEILKANKSKLIHGAVMHCFSGSKETAAELLKLGLYISFAGPLTFKNAKSLPEVAKYVPLDMILTETDSPFLSPHPLRGTVNGPKNVPIITACIAELKGETIEKTADCVLENAKRLFTKLKIK